MPIPENKNNYNLIKISIFVIIVCFMINPVLGIISLYVVLTYVKKNKFGSGNNLASLLKQASEQNSAFKNRVFPGLTPSPTGPSTVTDAGADVFSDEMETGMQNGNTLGSIMSPVLTKKRLEKRKKYLHIALNSTLEEARDIISRLPVSDRILIEAGTPLLKIYGTNAITQIKMMAPFGTYIVADNKCADLASREVEMMANAGANAATCLGVAPIETIDSFIEECEKFNIDSMIDMMNVSDALAVLKKLKKLPNVVMLHRGVDEGELSKEKAIPYYQIKQIKGNYNLMVAVAGGDDMREVQRAIFNDADIVVVWKNFYEASADTAELARSFLQEIK